VKGPLWFSEFFDAVTDTPVGAVLVTSDEEQHSDRQVMLYLLATSYPLQGLGRLEGEEVRIRTPV